MSEFLVGYKKNSFEICGILFTPPPSLLAHDTHKISKVSPFVQTTYRPFFWELGY
jgi:hypothetical protein